MRDKKAIVVGAGIGSLAASIRLAVKGYQVTVFDKNDRPGGKLTDFSIGKYRFDFGPSLFTMPQYVEELFTLANRDSKEYYDYLKLTEACRYFYPDETTFIAPTNPETFIQQAESTFDVDPKDLKQYFDYNKNIFNKAGRIFLTKSMHKLSTFLSLDAIKSVAQSYVKELFRTMNTANTKALKDPKLIQLFNRYATYNGSSPYQAPAMLNSISILEHFYGTYFPKKGMYAITQALYNLACELGVTFNFNQLVTEITTQNKVVTGVKTPNKSYPADVVFSNMDVSFTYEKLLHQKQLPYLQRNHEKSSSAIIFYWGIKHVFPQLGLHNIFFTSDYPKEFETIFQEKSICDDPTVYVNISSIYNDEDAPHGSANWFVMINAPSDSGQDWEKLIPKIKKQVLKKLSTLLKTEIEPLIEAEYIADPRTIQEKTLSHQGALYGSSSNHWLNAFLRHPNFSNELKGLYFVGGSVHPGGGIPLCLLSAKIATELLTDEI